MKSMDFCKNCGLIKSKCRCNNNYSNTESKIIRFYHENEKLSTAWIRNDKIKDRKGQEFLCDMCNNPLVYSKNKIFCPECDKEFILYKKFFNEKSNKSSKSKIKYINDVLAFKQKKQISFENAKYQSNLGQFNENTFKKLKPIDFSNVPNLFEDVFLLLTSNPQFYKENFKLILKDFYKDISSFSKNISKKNTNNGFKKVNSDEWSEFVVNIDDNYSISNIILNKNNNSNSNSNNPFNNKNNNKSKYEEVLLKFLLENDSKNFNYNLQFWSLISKFTLSLIKNYAFIPEILELDYKKFHIRWIPAIFNQIVASTCEKFLETCPDDLIVFNGSKISKKEQILTAISLLFAGFIEVFKKSKKTNNNSILNLKSDAKNNASILNLFLNANVHLENKEFLIYDWISNFYNKKRIYNLGLVIENFNDAFYIELIAKYGDLTQSIRDLIRTDNKTVKQQLFTDIELIKEVIPEIDDDLQLKKLNINFNIEELSNFLEKIEPLSKILGIEILFPNDLKNVFKPELILNFEENTKDKVEFFSLEDIISFDWKIAVGSKNYTKEEFKKLLNKSENLIKRNYNLNLLDEKTLLSSLKKMDNTPKKLNRNELLQGLLSAKLDDVNVNVDASLDNVIAKIKNYKKVKIPSSLNAKLRHYQANGYYWLVQNIQLGFGSILADDMGLGKTIQVLTTILHLKENNYLDEGKVLVVVPTSLLFNWEKEIEMFTPSLKSFIYHGPNRKFPEEDYDIILTSYGVLRRDLEIFKQKNWFLNVIDEAQNIKNPNAKQTKAIKSVRSKHKIALTGTPVENRLLEYWSIFDFTNKDYLYSSKKFKRKYINPIEKSRNKEILNNFKEITSPFILRRLKNDKKIINDLPDKNINDIYCNLTVEQAALYQKTLDLSLKEISYEQGIGRKGLIFKLINSLKQICNHPSQFNKSKIVKENDSGKMETLIEILKNINEVGEKTLIFTQYVQMGKIMKKVLEKKFDGEILFLHGSLSREERNEMINEFQNNPKKKIFILSLKVGGIGLNLTAAQNVIHYDLWWNPAVENQATDRVYRIGQKENIMVYRLITSGTFEEQINELLKKKEELFEMTISSGEKFLTEMTNNELKDMFTLR